MIVSAHQPHYMPWLGYLDKVAKADTFIFMDELQYEAQNYINRQKLKLSSGASWLIVPLVHGSQTDRISDKKINNLGSPRQHWQRVHFETMRCNYGRAPHFNQYADELQREIYAPQWENLADLNFRMLQLACTWFDITTPIIRESTLGLQGQKTDRIMDFCRKTGADAYFTGAGGSKEYLEVDRMNQAGIDVVWQHFEHPVYEQRYSQKGFIPKLGYLDYLFNCGEEKAKSLFSRNQRPLEALAA